MKRLLLFFLLVLIGAPLAAQPQLDLRLLRRNVPDYYYYQLYFTASCGDSIIYDLAKHQLILEEGHGLIDSNRYTIDRLASPTRNSCYDLVLVVDNSSTMSAADLAITQSALGNYIDTMSRDCQSAAVVSFADRPEIRSFLSNDRQAVRESIEGMVPSGKRALYDGLYTGLTELTTNGRQSVRIVLGITTGGDNASSMVFEELVDRALYHNIRLFLIGLGSDPPGQLLDSLCRSTGGLYYPVAQAGELPGLYTQLAGFFQREFDEHVIVRRTQDSQMKNMLIRLRLEACGDSVWVSRRFFVEPVVSVDPTATAAHFTLGQSWPNPLSARTDAVHFHFTVDAPNGLPLRLQIYDNLGRRVHTVFEREYAPGVHTVTWTAPQLVPGMYIYRLSRGRETTLGRMIVTP